MCAEASATQNNESAVSTDRHFASPVDRAGETRHPGRTPGGRSGSIKHSELYRDLNASLSEPKSCHQPTLSFVAHHENKQKRFLREKQNVCVDNKGVRTTEQWVPHAPRTYPVQTRGVQLTLAVLPNL